MRINGIEVEILADDRVEGVYVPKLLQADLERISILGVEIKVFPLSIEADCYRITNRLDKARLIEEYIRLEQL